jgi:iron(III) transport system permease protein
MAMLLLPVYLQAAGWDAGFGQMGWHSFARGNLAAPLLKGWRAAVWIHAMSAIPWVALIVGAAARYVDPDLEEEALLVGSPLQVFLRVSLPRMLAGVAVAAFWILLLTATEMTVTDLYRVRTYAEELYTGFALGDDLRSAWLTALPGGAALAAVVIATLAVAFAVAPALGTPTRSALTYRLGAWRLPACGVMVLLLLLVCGVPLANLVCKAGLVMTNVDGRLVRQWSVLQFTQVVAPSVWEYRQELLWSTLISAASATVAVAGGAALSWFARHGGWPSVPALAATAIGVALPGPLVGLAVIWLLDRPHPGLCVWLYDRTLFAPILAISIRLVPLASIFCWFVLRSVADDVLDSAACEGAGGWSRFWRIVVPQRWSGLVAAWLAMFALAAGDLACSILVVPPGVTTVPIRVFGLIHAGVDDQVAGICLTVLVAVAAVAAAVGWLLQLHTGAVSGRRRR